MKRLRQAGIVPDLIAGDFDSLGFKPETGKLLCLPVEKDVTDSYAAAMSAADEGFERIIIFGGTGGRTDTPSPTCSCSRLSQNAESRAFSRTTDAPCLFPDGGTTKIAARKSGYVSVFSLDTKCEGVTLKGLKYPLSGYTLTKRISDRSFKRIYRADGGNNRRKRRLSRCRGVQSR